MFERWKEKTATWAKDNAGTKRAEWVLAIVAFTEASFFLVPPDIFLIALLFVIPGSWKRLAIITTVWSVMGGLFGYVIGSYLFDFIGAPIIDTYNLSAQMAQVGEMFSDTVFVSMFVSAFTPIPYKVFTIAAGFFNVALFPVLLASILGRGLRYALIGYAMHKFGAKVGEFMYKRLNQTTLIAGIIILVLLVVWYI